jgi:Cu(I)/Ag(I) efflux system membrane protein CusA/SilA
MRWKKATIVAALVALVVSIYPASKLGSEFMPTLNEGTVLHAGLLPGMSITKAAELMQTQNKIIKSFPEVASVSARPAGQYGHRPGADRDVRDGHQPQAGIRMAPGMTTDKLIAEMDKALQFPVCRTPGRCRSRRASTCCPPASARPSASRSSARIWTKWNAGREIETVVKEVPGTTAFAERITGASTSTSNRPRPAGPLRAVGDVQDVIGKRWVARW